MNLPGKTLMPRLPALPIHQPGAFLGDKRSGVSLRVTRAQLLSCLGTELLPRVNPLPAWDQGPSAHHHLPTAGQTHRPPALLCRPTRLQQTLFRFCTAVTPCRQHRELHFDCVLQTRSAMGLTLLVGNEGFQRGLVCRSSFLRGSGCCCLLRGFTGSLWWSRTSN